MAPAVTGYQIDAASDVGYDGGEKIFVSRRLFSAMVPEPVFSSPPSDRGLSRGRGGRPR